MDLPVPSRPASVQSRSAWPPGIIATLNVLNVLNVFPRCAMRVWWGNAHVLTRCGSV
jgi:hypothetical protein